MKPSACPNCDQGSLTPFYAAQQLPIHSVLLHRAKKEAMQITRRDLELGFCSHCGFIGNRIFDPQVHSYNSNYEETQGFSPTFSRFHQKLAQRLIEQFDLRHKKVLEIGCGKGAEFLTLLCEMGNNTGVGFDPVIVPERIKEGANVELIKDFYSEKYAGVTADFICCKMTLEHIPDTLNFMKMVRSAVGSQWDTPVFFQVPAVERILHEGAFWDIYYEHCSYFSQTSLTYLFERAGFRVTSVASEYDDQYLTITAYPGKETKAASPKKEEVAAMKEQLRSGEQLLVKHLYAWNDFLSAAKHNEEKVVLWGGGSKAVAFSTSLKNADAVSCAIDINPHKDHTFLAGAGIPVRLPVVLTEQRPDKVILMNPIYAGEVQAQLNQMELKAELIAVDALVRTKIVAYG